jgi:hypothetical protein
MTAPKLKPGTPMNVRGSAPNIEAKTPRSHWHRVIQWWGKHWLTRRADGEWADGSGWGGKRTRATHKPAKAGQAREARRDDMRAARHAQTLREESLAYGGKEEIAAFYGTGREHRGHGTERKIKVTAADVDQDEADALEADRRAAARRRARAK